MRVTPLIFFAVAAVLPLALSAKDPSDVDASKKNEQLAPTPESADTSLSPNRATNQRTFIRQDHLQDQRFNAPDRIERKDAIVGERRAPIDITEKREKTIIDRKDYTKPEVRERELNRHDGERAGIQTTGDQVKSYDKVERYQGRMADAETAASQRQPKMEKRTTFDKLNRFVYKRNAPGSEGGKPVVTPAAGGSAPASQDTYTRYQIDWSRAEPPAR